MGDKLWSVLFTKAALNDLLEIIQYMLDIGEQETARALADKFTTDIRKSLTTHPHRGHPVPELGKAVDGFHEIHAKPYRIIYQVDEPHRSVWIVLIVHERRSVKDLTQGRAKSLK